MRGAKEITKSYCPRANNCSISMPGCPVPCRKAGMVSYQPFLDSSRPVRSDGDTELLPMGQNLCPALREQATRRLLAAGREEHSWAPKGLQRFHSREIFMEERC